MTYTCHTIPTKRWQFVGDAFAAMPTLCWALTLWLITLMAAPLDFGALVYTTAWMSKMSFIIFGLALSSSMIVAKHAPFTSHNVYYVKKPA